MKPAVDSDLYADLMGRIRRSFYQGRDKEFFQDQSILGQVITELASWLHERSVNLPRTQYQAIVLKVLRTAKEHGQITKVNRLSAYLLHCIQEHIKHHGEEYYDKAKSIRTLVEKVAHGLIDPAKAPAPDATVETLAAVHAALRSKGGRKKTAPPKDQLSLF